MSRREKHKVRVKFPADRAKFGKNAGREMTLTVHAGEDSREEIVKTVQAQNPGATVEYIKPPETAAASPTASADAPAKPASGPAEAPETESPSTAAPAAPVAASGPETPVEAK